MRRPTFESLLLCDISTPELRTYRVCMIETQFGRYNYRPQLCNYNQTAFYSQRLVNVSLEMCKFQCQNNMQECSGIFWNRMAGECWLTSYTGDGVDDSASCADPMLPWMFFRRRRVSCEQLLSNSVTQKVNFSNH